jgi:putative Ca2+/H+ antiporter (TMEM165/GDT1 family)
MTQLSIFISTFLIVFIGELGDKSQITAGTGTLAYTRNVKIIFFSSCLALICAAGIAVFGAWIIPSWLLPAFIYIGGLGLIVYGVHLFYKVGTLDVEDTPTDNNTGWRLFTYHFGVVFSAEMGDKTQIATIAIAIENQSELLTVFGASALALISVTGLTVWGVTRIPTSAIKRVQQIGALLMIAYGAYMLCGDVVARVL